MRSVIIRSMVATSIALAASATADVVGGGQHDPATPSERAGGIVQLQCWQYGNKIIDENNLQQLNTVSVSRENTLAFQRAGDSSGAQVLLISPNSGSICLLKPEH